MARVDEVGDGIYRISTTVALGEGAFQFNQFLIDDERPTLIHTGLFPMYEDVRKAVAEVLDPASLAYVVCPPSSQTNAAAWVASSRKPPKRCWPAARPERCST